MTLLEKLDPKTVSDRIASGDLVLIDIREPDEFAREHIEGATSLPLSVMDKSGLSLNDGKHAVFHCKSGMRTDANCARLASHVNGDAYLLDGGLQAWKAAGLPTREDTSAPLELNRQVQITAGALILLGVLLAVLVNSWFIGLSAFVGAGLMFAGLSGWCGMAQLLAIMPWNRRPQTS